MLPVDLLPYSRNILYLGPQFQNAIRSTGWAQTRTQICLMMYLEEGTYWSLSSLSEAVGLDRKSVRAQLDICRSQNMLEESNQGITLTDIGRKETEVMLWVYARHIPKETLAIFHRLFAKSPRPIVEIALHTTMWWRGALNSKKALSYLMIIDTIWGHRGKGWISIDEVCQINYSYSEDTIRKEITQAKKKGTVAVRKGFVSLTLKGRREVTSILMLGLKEFTIKGMKEILFLGLNSKPPHP